MGYLELPQIEVPHGKLTNTLLNNRNVYILDCHVDVYVWYILKTSNVITKSEQREITMCTFPLLCVYVCVYV